jgi:regulator of sigma E protease
VIDVLINIALLLFILVVLVVVHELGHFVTARLAGVRVHEFGVGFPPRARIIGRDKETIYTLNWLPIGGFVRLEGEEGESQDPRSFVRQRLPVKLVILLAGVTMNFLLAWLIFSAVAGFADPVTTVRIASVQPGSPASAAGLVPAKVNADGTLDKSGDTIVAVDGQQSLFFEGLVTGELGTPLAALREKAGQTVTLTVRGPDGSLRDVRATLRPPEQLEQGALGITTGLDFEDLRRDPVSAIGVGWDRTLSASGLILRSLRDLVGNLTSPNVAGPVGLVSAVGVVRTGFPPTFLLGLAAMLSANLAVVNVLPIPPMDGGRIFVSVAQALTGNRISVAIERATYLAGFILLFAFLIWVTWFDIQRLAAP